MFVCFILWLFFFSKFWAVYSIPCYSSKIFDFKYWQSKINNIFILISVFISNWNNVKILETFVLYLFWSFFEILGLGIQVSNAGDSEFERSQGICWVANARQRGNISWAHGRLTNYGAQPIRAQSLTFVFDVCLWRLSLSFQPISARHFDVCLNREHWAFLKFLIISMN